MYISNIIIEHFRGINSPIEYKFNAGLSVLVGENDSGKTTVIDAIRLVLGTTDQNWNRVELSDYYNDDISKDINISITFSNLTDNEKAAFLECLTYKSTEACLILNWNAKYITNIVPNRTLVTLTCGKNKDIAAPSTAARELLRVTFLKPLRDAHSQMRAGRYSRLAQILSGISNLNHGEPYVEGGSLEALSLTGIFDLSNSLLGGNEQLKSVSENISKILKDQMLLVTDNYYASISVSNSGISDQRKINALLEKLDLNAHNSNRDGCNHTGLGTSNLMSMACEMLLNQNNADNSSFLLIEEPEAHIHAQRQLKLIQSMQKQCNEGHQQIIITTHSLMLASTVQLSNLIMLVDNKPYPMGPEHTKLDEDDYQYLERYLDVTKSNLFFARGVIIVEGPAEELLLPSLARAMNRDLASYGISIVNVRSTGLRRYGRIFQRSDETNTIDIHVACITDRDVLPDCAPWICLKTEYKDSSKWPEKRKWVIESEVTDKDDWEQKIKEKADGQNVKTFVPKQWTLEYELAASGFAEEMIKTISRMVALTAKEKTEEEYYKGYKTKYDSFTLPEEKFSYIYSFFSKNIVSKAEFAQVFSVEIENMNQEDVIKKIPQYLIDAINYVTEV